MSRYIGIDIAQGSFVAATWEQEPGQVLGEFANTEAGYEALARALGEEGEVALVMEATGGYELGLVVFAYARGWQVCLPNPKQVRKWAEGIGRRAKTDSQDALLLARFGVEQRPSGQEQLPAIIQELDDLLRRRDDLDKLLRSERNRLLNYRQRPQPNAAVLDSMESSVSHLEEELAKIEQAINELIHRDPDVKATIRRLRTVPGVGPRNALVLLVVFHRWQARAGAEADSKGLVAFTGLDPQPHESGRSVRKRATISKMGDRSCRRLLYMGALGGLRADSPLRHFYQRLVGRGKAKRLALVAAARKILVWAWAVFTSGTPFDPSRFQLTPASAA
jgi:transposase